MRFPLNSASKKADILLVVFTHVEIKPPILTNRVRRLFSYHYKRVITKEEEQTKPTAKRKKDTLVLFRVIDQF